MAQQHNTSHLNLYLLEQGKVPQTWFAKYAGFSRIAVALWMAAYRKDEVRPIRDMYYNRAKDVLLQIERAVKANKLPTPKANYDAFAALMEKFKADN